MRQPLSASVLLVHSSAQPMPGTRRRQRFSLALHLYGCLADVTAALMPNSSTEGEHHEHR
jgi:hypothetical protein